MGEMFFSNSNGKVYVGVIEVSQYSRTLDDYGEDLGLIPSTQKAGQNHP